MPSIKARVITFLLRNRHLMKFRFKKQIIDWTKYEAILYFRKEVEEGAQRFGKLPEGIELVPVNIDSLYAEWIMPTHGVKDRFQMYG